MPLLRISSCMMPTARWVLPTPMGPRKMRPRFSPGYSSTNRPAISLAVASDRFAPWKSMSKSASVQCSYLAGILAALNSFAVRSPTQHSQRLTRLDFPGTGTVFHPVPEQTGHCAGAVVSGVVAIGTYAQNTIIRLSEAVDFFSDESTLFTRYSQLLHCRGSTA